MRKFLLPILFFCALVGNAQTISTKSSCDSNADDEVTINDVTNTVNKILGKSASEKEVVTADDLYPVLQALDSRLSLIESKLGIDRAAHGEQDGREYVDLGLSVKWATMNVGATEVAGSKVHPQTGKLDCYGQYYAWGETTGYNEVPNAYPSADEGDWVVKNANPYYQALITTKTPKTDFTELRYKWEFPESATLYRLTKYKAKENSVLLPSDDAAAVNWGGSWRMPTEEEAKELDENCYSEWTKNYKGTGVAGVIFYKAKSDADKGRHIHDWNEHALTEASYTLSDTHIFIPGAGGFEYDEQGNYNEGGVHVWTSSLSNYYSTPRPCYLDYWSEGDGLEYAEYRSNAHSVRAVCP